MIDCKQSPFNSALETGVRTLTILTASFPTAHDLSRLVQYDYLTVHSADAGGPPSIHPPLPFRSGEILVRRGLIESGLHLMISRALVSREFHANGFLYKAEESAEVFLGNMQSNYILELRNRAYWVADTFDTVGTDKLNSIIDDLFETWTIEFQPIQLSSREGRF